MPAGENLIKILTSVINIFSRAQTKVRTCIRFNVCYNENISNRMENTIKEKHNRLVHVNMPFCLMKLIIRKISYGDYSRLSL